MESLNRIPKRSNGFVFPKDFRMQILFFVRLVLKSMKPAYRVNENTLSSQSSANLIGCLQSQNRSKQTTSNGMLFGNQILRCYKRLASCNLRPESTRAKTTCRLTSCKSRSRTSQANHKTLPL